MFNSLFSFYRSKEWETLRQRLNIERVNQDGDLICEHCKKPIIKVYDAICHHNIELTEANVNDFTISLNPDNIIIVHHKCHNAIHNRFGSYTRHIYIVWGSYCAGKSTYVNENALKDDLIVDIDRIYEAIGNGRSNRLYDNVMQIQRQLIDMIKTRNGRWVNAWVVGGYPLRMDRERLSNMLGAELIHIDTNKETCLARAKVRGGDYVKWVNNWWDKYQE